MPEPPPPSGNLVLFLQPPPWPISPARVSPVVELDGWASEGRWGRNIHPVPPQKHSGAVAVSLLLALGVGAFLVGPYVPLLMLIAAN